MLPCEVAKLPSGWGHACSIVGGSGGLDVQLVFHPSGGQWGTASCVVEEQESVSFQQMGVMLLGESTAFIGEGEIALGASELPHDCTGVPVNPDHHVHVPDAKQDVPVLQGFDGVLVIGVDEGGLPNTVRAESGRNVVGCTPHPADFAVLVQLLDDAVDDCPGRISRVGYTVGHVHGDDFRPQEQPGSIRPQLKVMEIRIGANEFDDLRCDEGAVQFMPPSIQGREPHKSPILMAVEIESLEGPDFIVTVLPGFVNHDRIGEIRVEPGIPDDPSGRELLAGFELDRDVKRIIRLGLQEASSHEQEHRAEHTSQS